MIMTEETWTSLVPTASSQGQHLLQQTLQQLFPSHPQHINYRHPHLLHTSSRTPMELDIYIPSLQLAFEFHGQQHFHHGHRGLLLEQQQRDREKIEACRKVGVTLVIVPYWWDRKKESLMKTIKQLRPDIVFSVTTATTTTATNITNDWDEGLSSVLPIPSLPLFIEQQQQKMDEDAASVFVKMAHYHDNVQLERK